MYMNCVRVKKSNSDRAQPHHVNVDDMYRQRLHVIGMTFQLLKCFSWRLICLFVPQGYIRLTVC